MNPTVRGLLEKMNFTVIEAENSGVNAIYGGDSLNPMVSDEKILAHMKKRADAMPVLNVAICCVSCIMLMKSNPKKQRCMADLLFSETTDVGRACTSLWYKEPEAFIKSNTSMGSARYKE